MVGEGNDGLGFRSRGAGKAQAVVARTVMRARRDDTGSKENRCLARRGEGEKSSEKRNLERGRGGTGKRKAGKGGSFASERRKCEARSKEKRKKREGTIEATRRCNLGKKNKV